MSKVNVIILAAGKGKRLKASQKPKVMYPLRGKPIIGHIMEKFIRFKPADKIIVVVGYQGQQIIDYLNAKFKNLKPKVQFVWQKKRLGTAHAVKPALPLISKSPYPTVVFNGDHPYFSPATVRKLVRVYHQKKPTLVSTILVRKGKSSFGRVIKDNQGFVKKVVEVKNCTPSQLKIREVNVGAYLFDTDWLQNNLSRIKKNPISGEYYLTDAVGLAVSQGKKVITSPVVHPSEAIGINTLQDLREAEEVKYN